MSTSVQIKDDLDLHAPPEEQSLEATQRWLPYNYFPSLRQLRTFIAVAQTESISRASAELNLSQSAVTQSIAKLEAAFDVQLFLRRNKGTYLTDIGIILKKRSDRFFAALHDALVEFSNGGKRGDAVAQIVSKRLTRAQLLALIAINELGSFMQAARYLGISPPSLHRAARSLETELHLRIFHNTAHGVTTNEYGKRAAHRLQLAIREFEWAREEIEVKNGVTQGRILVGALMLAGSYHLASVLHSFLGKYPSAKVEMTNGTYDTLLDKLRTGSIDFVVGLLKNPPPVDDVIEQVLLPDPFVLAVRRDHPLANLPVVTKDDLSKFDWILPSPMASRRVTYERLFDGLSKSRANIETHSLTTILVLLARSDRIAILTESELLLDRQLGHHLTALNYGPLYPTASIGVTTRRSWLPTALQRHFMDSLLASSNESTSPVPTGDLISAMQLN